LGHIADMRGDQAPSMKMDGAYTGADVEPRLAAGQEDDGEYVRSLGHRVAASDGRLPAKMNAYVPAQISQLRDDQGGS
jgi:hypothetical protein